jgi:small subunit ribosomal protein S8
MAINDPIGDFLTRVRNGQQARLKTITVPASKQKTALAQLLKDEGYILDFSTAEVSKGIAVTTVVLKYFEGRPVIETIQRISKPSLRVYRGKDELPKVLGGLGVAVISTPKGLLSDRKAREIGQGGEVLCYVA